MALQQVHYFVRGDENSLTGSRQVWEHDDGTYRIWTETGLGKLHKNVEEYLTEIKEKGWTEVSHVAYLRSRAYGKVVL
jgi:hypothetical protein